MWYSIGNNGTIGVNGYDGTIVRRVGIGKGRRKRKDGETVGDRNRDWGQSEEGAMNSLWGKVGRVGGGQRGSGHPIG